MPMLVDVTIVVLLSNNTECHAASSIVTALGRITTPFTACLLTKRCPGPSACNKQSGRLGLTGPLTTSASGAKHVIGHPKGQGRIAGVGMLPPGTTSSHTHHPTSTVPRKPSLPGTTCRSPTKRLWTGPLPPPGVLQVGRHCNIHA